MSKSRNDRNNYQFFDAKRSERDDRAKLAHLPKPAQPRRQAKPARTLAWLLGSTK